MEDIIDIIVTETTNTIEITAQPNDEIIDVNIIDNREDVTLNVTPTVVEININTLTGNFGVFWGDIQGTLSNQTDLNNALALKANLVGGKVPASELPSYVDDVVEVANFASLPATGETGKIYITLDTNFIYRWTGSTYVEIKDSSAVWGAITGTLSNQTDLQSALNAKDAILTFNSPLSRSTNTVSIPAASTSVSGHLTSTDWNTFNGKQNALNGTGFVKASGTTISYDNSTYLTTGTAASTYVPYTGATGAVNLGIHSIGAQFGAFNEIVSNNNNFGDIGSASNAFKNIYGYSFIKIGGTSAQFLKADGSVDSTAYLSLAGGTITGIIDSNNFIITSSQFAVKKNSSATSSAFYGFQNAAGTNRWNISIDNAETGSGNTGFDFNIYRYDDAGATLSSALNIKRSTGNIGIGTSSNATRTLEVAQSSGYSAGIRIIGNTGGDAKIQFLASGASSQPDIGPTVAYPNDLIFGAGGSEKMRITSDGKVGIGTMLPSQPLEIGGTGNILVSGGATIFSGAGSLFVRAGSGGDLNLGSNNTNSLMRITSGGITRALRFQVGAAGIAAGNYCEFGNDDNVGYVDTVRAVNSGDFHFRFDGTSRASINRTTGVYVATSDINKKKDLEESKIGLNEVLQLKPTLYRMKSDTTKGEKELGFIAQEVKGIIPSAYQESGDFIGLNYNPIVAALTKAVQELEAKIKTLENK
jgi:hypothetical protein